jgi:hypothetical protein
MGCFFRADMRDSTSETHPRIRIGGIKLSPELVQFSFSRPVGQESQLSAILRAIAGRAVNIPFLSLSSASGGSHISLCVAAESHIIVRTLIEYHLQQRQQIHCLPEVGTISLFPHRYSFELVGRLISRMVEAEIPIYGICSSISALTVVTVFRRQEDAVTALESFIELPANHAPFRQEFDIRQISS